MTRSALIVPGRNHGASVPQLFLPMVAAMRRGARADTVAWSDPAAADGFDAERKREWVQGQVRDRLDRLEPADGLVIAKSLGTYLAGPVADRGLPAIWVTPLLTDPLVVDALRRAPAPFLLAGGTADPLWRGDVARSLSPYVLELTGADHGLFVDGPLTRSVDNLGRLTDAVEAFLDEVVWPPSTFHGVGDREERAISYTVKSWGV